MKRETSGVLFKSNLISIALALIVFVMVNPWGTSAQAADKEKVFRWRMQHPWVAGTNYDKAAQAFVNNIKAMSNGRLDIKMFPVGSLMGTAQTFDAVRKGVMEGHINITVYWTGKIPAATFLCFVPGAGFMSLHDFKHWYKSGGGLEMAREEYAKFGLQFVGVSILENMAPILSKKGRPIRNLSDLQGLKVRGTPGMLSELFKALGASPVFMQVGDVYSSMETGVIDAVAGMTAYGWYKFGIHELSGTMTWPNLWIPAASIETVFNMKAWNSLPPDLQAIVEVAVDRFHLDNWTMDQLANIEAIEAMKAAGVEELFFSESDVKKVKEIALSIADEVAAKDPLSEKVWTSQKAFMKKLEGAR